MNKSSKIYLFKILKIMYQLQGSKYKNYKTGQYKLYFIFHGRCIMFVNFINLKMSGKIKIQPPKREKQNVNFKCDRGRKQNK